MRSFIRAIPRDRTWARGAVWRSSLPRSEPRANRTAAKWVTQLVREKGEMLVGLPAQFGIALVAVLRDCIGDPAENEIGQDTLLAKADHHPSFADDLEDAAMQKGILANHRVDDESQSKTLYAVFARQWWSGPKRHPPRPDERRTLVQLVQDHRKVIDQLERR